MHRIACYLLTNQSAPYSLRQSTRLVKPLEFTHRRFCWWIGRLLGSLWPSGMIHQRFA
jgi:hypothetical protein